MLLKNLTIFDKPKSENRGLKHILFRLSKVKFVTSSVSMDILE